jgi:phospholipid/cholesterol/gamma-HCH transport system permease protein
LQQVSESSLPSVIGDSIKHRLFDLQEFFLMSARSVTNLFSAPFYLNDTIEQMDVVGVGSLPIVLLAGFFIGAVTVLQTASQFERFGETSLTGDVVAIALVRELGPTITALLVAGRNAAGMASELGSMVVTEQIDAMRAMGTDPSRKLVTPRVTATLFTLPLLTAVADLIGLVGGYTVSHFTLRLSAVEFWNRAIHALEFGDIVQGMVKPLIFGFILSTVGCYAGLTVRGGTQGVGRATTTAVVIASVSILVVNAFITRLLLFIFSH